MRFKKFLAGALIVTSIVGLFAYAVFVKGDKNRNAVPVTYGTVARKSISTSIYTNGKVMALEERSVTGEIVGKISGVKVSVGDKVSAGSVLATIDTSDTANAIRQQEVSLESDAIALNDLRTNGQKKYEIQLSIVLNAMNDAKKSYDDKVELYKADAISEYDVDAAKATYERSKNDYESLRINSNDLQIKQQQKKIEGSRLQLQKLRESLSKGTVKSPISGVVAAVNVKNGDYATQGVPMFTVDNIDSLKVETSISEFDINKVKIGQRVDVGTEGGNVFYKGKVLKIAPSAVIQTTGTNSETVVKTEVALENGPTLLKPNFNVKLTIFTNRKDNVLAVPLEALVEKDDGKKYVFAIGKDNRVTQKAVGTGLEGDTNVEIRSGLAENESIVLSPPDTLKTGDLVKKSEEPKK